jgi:hypothetical protein
VSPDLGGKGERGEEAARGGVVEALDAWVYLYSIMGEEQVGQP